MNGEHLLILSTNQNSQSNDDEKQNEENLANDLQTARTNLNGQVMMRVMQSKMEAMKLLIMKECAEKIEKIEKEVTKEAKERELLERKLRESNMECAFWKQKYLESLSSQQESLGARQASSPPRK